MKREEGIRQKFAVIENGLCGMIINILSFGAAQENMMRLVSGSIAKDSWKK
ncbi:MAG: hypothetical protein ACOX7B_15575 [Christensenellales bacterium]